MDDFIDLGYEVEIVTDRFASVGAPRGSIGVVVDDWVEGMTSLQEISIASWRVEPPSAR